MPKSGRKSKTVEKSTPIGGTPPPRDDDDRDLHLPEGFGNDAQGAASSTYDTEPSPSDPVANDLSSRFEDIPTAGEVLGGHPILPTSSFSANMKDILRRLTSDLPMDASSSEACAKLLPDLVSSHYSEELIRTCFELILVDGVNPVSLMETLPALQPPGSARNDDISISSTLKQDPSKMWSPADFVKISEQVQNHRFTSDIFELMQEAFRSKLPREQQDYAESVSLKQLCTLTPSGFLIAVCGASVPPARLACSRCAPRPIPVFSAGSEASLAHTSGVQPSSVPHILSSMQTSALCFRLSPDASSQLSPDASTRLGTLFERMVQHMLLTKDMFLAAQKIADFSRCLYEFLLAFCEALAPQVPVLQAMATDAKEMLKASRASPSTHGVFPTFFWSAAFSLFNINANVGFAFMHGLCRTLVSGHDALVGKRVAEVYSFTLNDCDSLVSQVVSFLKMVNDARASVLHPLSSGEGNVSSTHPALEWPCIRQIIAGQFNVFKYIGAEDSMYRDANASAFSSAPNEVALVSLARAASALGRFEGRSDAAPAPTGAPPVAGAFPSLSLNGAKPNGSSMKKSNTVTKQTSASQPHPAPSKQSKTEQSKGKPKQSKDNRANKHDKPADELKYAKNLATDAQNLQRLAPVIEIMSRVVHLFEGTPSLWPISLSGFALGLWKCIASESLLVILAKHSLLATSRSI